MVKTFEELNKNSLDEKKLNTLFAIYSRYITNTYKQFGWRIDDGGSFIRYLSNSRIALTFEYLHYMDTADHFIRSVIEHPPGKAIKIQSFPITSTKSKDLGKLAHNIFKWNKSIIDKL